MREASLCPTFYPTLEEFSNLVEYVSKVESQTKGMFKIVPPEGWKPRKKGYEGQELEHLKISTPIRQYVSGGKGVYQVVNVIEKKEIGIDQFKQEADRLEMKNSDDFDKLERFFWKNITFNAGLYGADLLGSLFDDDVKECNLKKLDSILNIIRKELPGITTPYLYFGMFKSLFAAHKEDLDLYSINYLHFGKPKIWYTVSPNDAERLEAFAKAHFPEMHKDCDQFLRHKTTIFSPSMLAAANIPLTKAIQNPGEIVITMPSAYHFGWNSGFNCAEAVNFATERWINIGLRAKPCVCVPDNVRIDMPAFIEAYEAWKQGVLPINGPIEPALEPVYQRNKRERKSPTKASPATFNKKQRQSHTPTVVNKDIEEGEWEFTCLCTEQDVVTFKDDVSLHPSGRMFECTTCKRWSHVDCYPKYTAKASLPKKVFCHKCAKKTSPRKSPTGKQTKSRAKTVRPMRLSCKSKAAISLSTTSSSSGRVR